MKPSRTPSKLSDSLRHDLNIYAFAASAAGVSALALTSPAEAKIIYTPTHHVIRVGDKYNLQLYHHGQVDFVLFNSSKKSTSSAKAGGEFGIEGGGSRNAIASGNSTYDARAYHKGSAIHPPLNAQAVAGVIARSGTRYTGSWYPNKKDLYVGLRFYIGEESHYGWARISVSGNGAHAKWETVGTLTGYAFETVPNRPIIAGKTKGPDVITLKPATLARLALGKTKQCP